jgi:hypothetical protein
VPWPNVETENLSFGASSVSARSSGPATNSRYVAAVAACRIDASWDAYDVRTRAVVAAGVELGERRRRARRLDVAHREERGDVPLTTSTHGAAMDTALRHVFDHATHVPRGRR